MTEAEWLASEDPTAMLLWRHDMDQVNPPPRGRGWGMISDRKLRLFACACCRSLWHLLTDERSRKAVEVAERFADGWAKPVDMARARRSANEVRVCGEEGIAATAAGLCVWPIHERAATVAENVTRQVAALKDGSRLVPPAAQAAILRDIVGSPFRPVAFDAAWRTPQVLSLAQAAYEGRHPETGRIDDARLAVLSDALEEAGCPAEEMGEVKAVTAGIECPVCGGKGWWRRGVHFDHMRKCSECKASAWVPGEEYAFRTPSKPNPILAHLRSGGPHYRGCWALDLILGKS